MFFVELDNKPLLFYWEYFPGVQIATAENHHFI